MQPRDENHSFVNPWTTKPIKGQYAESRSQLDTMSKEKRRLWILMTTVRLKNIEEYDNYTPASLVTMKKVRAALNHPVIDSTTFKSLLLKVLDIVKWREGLGLKTILVLEPPPLQYVAGWERIFAEHGIKIAWVDENDCAVIPVYETAGKKRHLSSSHTGNFLKQTMLTVEGLAEGESLKVDIGTLTLVDAKQSMMLDSWWGKKRPKFKRKKSDVLNQWILRVRSVGKRKFGSYTRFEVLYSKERAQNYIVIRRRTAQEELECKNPAKNTRLYATGEGEIFV